MRSAFWWYCNVCRSRNAVVDGECQYCECQGAVCERDNCSDPRHFTAHNADHQDNTRT